MKLIFILRQNTWKACENQKGTDPDAVTTCVASVPFLFHGAGTIHRPAHLSNWEWLPSLCLLSESSHLSLESFLFHYNLCNCVNSMRRLMASSLRCSGQYQNTIPASPGPNTQLLCLNDAWEWSAKWSRLVFASLSILTFGVSLSVWN